MAARGLDRPLRIAVLTLLAVLAVCYIIRAAAVADRQARPALAEALWPSHPDVVTASALLNVAAAASRSGPVPQSVRSDVRRIAAKAPLSPDPFLIEGAIVGAEGDGRAAERLWLAARERDPRSRGARFLLAERFLRTGRIAAGLIEMQSLVRLQSRGVELFAPSLVAYARTPGAVPQLRVFFRQYPRSEAGILSVLAVDPTNAALVLALASNSRNPDPDWRRPLIAGLAASGDFAKAHALWARLSGIRAVRGLFNAAFETSPAPPPFNWSFPETGDGIAEPDGEGGLSVLFYGRANALLASQLLTLPPGQYTLAASVRGEAGEGAIRWLVRCSDDSRLLGSLPLRRGAISGQFAVPDGCEGQWLELQGVASESPVTVELTLSNLRLAKVPRP